ncbi:MAG TPA: flagellar basal body-associated FliL family protein [Burkholderiaceae bacterium]|nr:flagellar basal body-associated FliL family protein [Burkholderiaceae bacterium]
MADEQEQQEGGKKKSPLKLILLIVGLLVLLAVTVVATLAVTGFFSQPDPNSVEELLKKAEAEKAAEEAKAAEGEGAPKLGPDGKPLPATKETPDNPDKVTKNAADVKKFESRYKEMGRPLLANVTGSRKVMQVTVAIMTHYDDNVLQNMEKHDFALRNAALDVMRQVTEAEIDKPTFRIELAEKIRLAMNAVLEKYEDFGGIEQVLFTEFVVQ